MDTDKTRPLKRTLPLSPSHEHRLSKRRKRAMRFGITIPDDDEHDLPPPPKGKMIGIVYDPLAHNHGDDDFVLERPCYLTDCGSTTESE